MINTTSDTVKRQWLDDTKRRWLYVGLFTDEPRMFEDTSEVTGSYARQKVTWSGISNGGIMQNTNWMYFGGIDFGLRITHIGLFTDTTSNECGFYGPLQKATVVARGSLVENADDEYKRLGLGEFWLPPKAVTIRIA